MTKVVFCSGPFVCLYSEFNFHFCAVSPLIFMAFAVEVHVEEKGNQIHINFQLILICLSVLFWYHMPFEAKMKVEIKQ